MSSASSFAFLFVHGAWHDSATWSKIIPMVQNRLPGVVCVTVDLPSTSRYHATVIVEDISVVREAALKLVAENKQVIIVMHSYGGLVGTNAVKGLSEEERGGIGAVVGMIYISAYVRSLGQSLIEEGMAFKQVGDVNQEEMTITLPASDALDLFYHDLPEDEAHYFANRLKAQALSTSFGQSLYEPWTHGIRCQFVLTEGDHSIPPPYQEKMANRGNMNIVRISGASHSVMLSQPEATTEALVSFVESM